MSRARDIRLPQIKNLHDKGGVHAMFESLLISTCNGQVFIQRRDATMKAETESSLSMSALPPWTLTPPSLEALEVTRTALKRAAHDAHRKHDRCHHEGRAIATIHG